jgi:hypothetical protein
VLDDVEYDDAGSPAIGLLPPGVPWQDIEDHIKISHHPLLVLRDGSDEYTGVYWADAAMSVLNGLGPDLDEAIAGFRDYLREHGQA